MRKEPVFISQKEIGEQSEAMDALRAMATRPQSYHIVTYGCQMNAHDSEKLAGMLSMMGMRESPDRKQADLVLFNTCCVRENAGTPRAGQHHLAKATEK